MPTATAAVKKHILVVDDEANIRELLEEYLTQNGFRVTPVQSAMEAKKVARTDPPDLIISDLQLEESDGLEMIASLKETLPDTPMMLLTGVLFDPKVVRDTLSKKVSCYLDKTASLAQILTEVRRLLAR
jgi:two-component system phosphate regulon response regulator OmpR